MHNYKMIALDMDGTLLDSGKRIMQETISDIEAASAAGKLVVLCTGRGKMEIKEYRDQILTIRYAVLLSGALIYDLYEEKIIYQKLFPGEYVDRIISVAERYDGMIHYMTADHSVVRKDQVCQMSQYNMGIYQEMFSRVTDKADDVRKHLELVGTPLKMLIYFRNTRDRERGFEDLKELALEFVYAETSSLEMTPKGIDKGEGLKRLSQNLGIAMDEIAAIGDSANDIQMFKAAGCSVAMKNASDEIKALCDLETDDNDHNGVGKAIRDILQRS